MVNIKHTVINYAHPVGIKYLIGKYERKSTGELADKLRRLIVLSDYVHHSLVINRHSATKNQINSGCVPTSFQVKISILSDLLVGNYQNGGF